MSVSYHHLDLNERREIHKGLDAKRSASEIARHLGRHRSTNYRDLERNTTWHEDHFLNGYFPVNAQETGPAPAQPAQEAQPAARAQGTGHQAVKETMDAADDCRRSEAAGLMTYSIFT